MEILKVLPSDNLAGEMARVARVSVKGYSDDRPIDGRLVQSRLNNPITGEPPICAVARDLPSGDVIGWAAVRASEAGEKARLWGPVVLPSAEECGIGSALINSVTAKAGVGLVTTDVPRDRATAHRFFEKYGWIESGGSTIFVHDLASTTPRANQEIVRGESVSPDVLISVIECAATRKGRKSNLEAAKFPLRWRSDHRYESNSVFIRPNCGCLALGLYQSAQGESEILIAELWCDCRRCEDLLVDAVLTAGQRQGAERARAVTVNTSDLFLRHKFRLAGLTVQYEVS